MMIRLKRGLLVFLCFLLSWTGFLTNYTVSAFSVIGIPIYPEPNPWPSLPSSLPVSLPEQNLDENYGIIGSLLRDSSVSNKEIKAYIGEQQLLVFEQRYTIRNYSSSTAKDVELKILLLPEELPEYQFVFEERIWPEVNRFEIDAYGNRYAYVRSSSLEPGEEMLVTVAYNLASSSWEIDKSLLYNYDAPFNIDELSLMLQAELLIESDNHEIITKAYSIIGGETNPYRKAEMLFSWVNANLTYDEDPNYAHKGAYAALKTQRGVCTENAALLVAMMRATGIPARMVGGYLFQPEAKADRSMPLNGEQMAHAWVEFYLEGFGWVSCEPTYELIENGMRNVALKHFAAMPQWGHIAVCYGFGEGSNVSYSGFPNMLNSEMITTFQYGQRLMDNEIKIYLDDWESRILFPDQEPLLLGNGVTMVPMRRIFELLRATVNWDEEQKLIKAFRNERIVELHLNQPNIWVNGSQSSLLMAPFVSEETARTLVPLRAISEGLGAGVSWDALRRRILIVPPSN